MQQAAREIAIARKYETYEEYFTEVQSKHGSYLYGSEQYKAQDIALWNRMKKYWENEKKGIVLTHAASATLRKLESLGLIEIIFDSAGQHYGIDSIRIIAE